MPHASLQDFVSPVSVCFQTDRLVTVLDMLQNAQSDGVIVLQCDRTPLGILRFKQLLSVVWKRYSFLQGENAATEWASLAQMTLMDLNAWLQPVAILPVSMSLLEVQQRCQSLDQTWCVVDDHQQVLGVLNLAQFWLSWGLSARSPEDPPLRGNPSGTITLSYAQTPEVPTPPPSVLVSALEVNSPEGFGRRLALAGTPHLASLVDIIEQLPLPLMLQTQTGQVILQNQLWRQQLGQLDNPMEVGQAAADVLGQPSSPPCVSDASSPESAIARSRTSSNPKGEATLNSREVGSLEENPICKIGGDCNTCVCICAMKNGQERIWEFIKMPIGAIVPGGGSLPQPTEMEPQFNFVPWHLEAQSLRSHRSVWIDPTTPDSFHLATLGLSSHASLPPDLHPEMLWLVLAQDTTEEQRVGKELAAKNADLIQLNRLKDEFLACISHELKTPLTAILGLSSLLKDGLLGEMNERQLRYAQLIYQSGRHLMLIVNDILDLTRIETGQLELNLEPVSIAAACDRAYAQAYQHQPNHSAESQPGSTDDLASNSGTPSQFTCTIQPGLETLVADEMRLRQMLSNLLSNALKFTETGGEIGLDVESWENWIAFTVWDTGIGIPLEKQHLIFQKFQQLENPLTRRFEGTGLGLVLTQRLAWLHGGDVTFTSVEGEGSRFTLLLPSIPLQAVNTLDSRQIESVSPLPSSPSRRLVLVMEGVPCFLETLTNQLAQLGYKVAIARSGTEALEKARRLQPAVIFLNPVLPMLSGWDVLTLLKSSPDTQHIPVVVTTTPADKQKAHRNGANVCLGLPVESDVLAQTLTALIPSTPPPPLNRALLRLTILHLRPGLESLALPAVDRSLDGRIANLNHLLHAQHYRVLEVDDLEQADLLARVWKPNVILLDGISTEPLSYLRQLSAYDYLRSLPLVTLTAEMTHAANQIEGLAVFPCLAAVSLPHQGSDPVQASTLLQVLQIAAGMTWMPHLLIMESAPIDKGQDALMEDVPQRSLSEPSSEQLHSLMQYLKTAGVRTTFSRNWSVMQRHLNQQDVDLVLIRVCQPTNQPLLLKSIQILETLDIRPPLLVWCDPTAWESEDGLSTQETQTVIHRLEAIATRTLSPSVSIEELLAQINHILGHHRDFGSSPL